jgi:hypothetical protein
MAPPRTLEQRRGDTLHRLKTDIDAWVATTGDDIPCIVPLSFHWDGEALLLSTLETNPTAKNITANGQVRITLGETRDVVLIAGVGTRYEPPAEVAAAFAAKAGFDPTKLERYPFFRVTPRSVQAWREVNEIPGRDIMRDGEWI